jgi:hypothetical protein
MPNICDVEEEIYTHEYLWRSSTVLLEKAKAEEQTSYHLLLPALLMAFLAHESFINFCGFVCRPDLWKDEKRHFKGKGLEGKIEVLVAALPDFNWQKGQRPYQTIKTLEAFRDVVAHGKVVASQYVAEQQEGGLQFSFTHVWDNYISRSAVEGARADIQEFSQSLLVELRKVSDHLHLNFDAFEGSLASGSSTSVG